MKYTFVDIGCGHFATSADIFGTKCNGLLVEPIQEYCNVLPNSNTVKIECSAVSEYNGVRDIFCCVVPDPIYVPKKILDHKQQFERIRKSVAMHGTTSFYGDPIRGIKNAKEIKRTVNTITLKTLFNKYKITEIDYLKIDVEGYEVVVLTQLIDLLRDNTIKINKELKFEYHNDHNLYGDDYLKQLDVLRDTIASEFEFSWSYQDSFPWDKDIVMIKI